MAALNKRPHPMTICHGDVAVEKVLMDCCSTVEKLGLQSHWSLNDS